jgi:hypothetical protein
MRTTKKSPDYKFLGNCPICSKKFKAEAASTLDKVYDMRTVYVECVGCKSSVILGIVRNVPGVVTTVGMLTDMNKSDIRRSANLSPISADDVLEVHQYFEKY